MVRNGGLLPSPVRWSQVPLIAAWGENLGIGHSLRPRVSGRLCLEEDGREEDTAMAHVRAVISVSLSIALVLTRRSRWW